jgi:hypothetical protein
MKIGIFLPGGHGDIMSAMSVLKYKDVLWPGAEIQWFCSPVESEVLKFAPVEIKLWEDFTELIRVNQGRDNFKYNDVKDKFPNVKGLDKEYFPAPWMYEPHQEQRKGKDYPSVSKGVFGVDPSWEWHPMLYFSDEEREMVKDYCLSLPHKRTIMLETDFRSGQSTWNDNMTRQTMMRCRSHLGPCNFIFASEKDHSRFVDDAGVVTCSHLSVRQCALVNDYADLFVGVSSGISVATSCWGAKPVPKIQYTNTFVCSTVSIANGPIDLIEIHSTPNPEVAFYLKLTEILKRLK